MSETVALFIVGISSGILVGVLIFYIVMLLRAERRQPKNIEDHYIQLLLDRPTRHYYESPTWYYKETKTTTTTEPKEKKQSAESKEGGHTQS